VNDVPGGSPRLQPQFWYDLPHGYLQLDIRPSREQLDETARQILALPDDQRERADSVFRLYALVMWEMQQHRVQGCAIGLHPDDEGGTATSVLTVSSVGVEGVNPKAVLARLLASGAGGDSGTGVVPVRLPSGPGFMTEAVRRSKVPGGAAQGADGPAEVPCWQGLVAIPDMRSSAIVAVQLVTPAVRLADDYRNVLRGVASTVSFTDPALTGTGERPEPEPGSAAYAVRNDFG
jgi:hypothetical protein